MKEIIGDYTDYIISNTTLTFGVGAAPDNCIKNETICFNFTAEQDDIKEEDEKFQLYLSTSDPDIEFCYGTAHITIEEDDNDGTMNYNTCISVLVIIICINSCNCESIIGESSWYCRRE